MPILPGVASYEELGGTINDYDAIVDPTTDLPSEADSKSRAIVAGLSRLAIRVRFRFTNNGVIGTLDTESFDSVVGKSSALYPSILRVADGQYRFVFPASCTDALGQTQAFSFNGGRAQIMTGAPGFTRVEKLAPNIVELFLWAANGIEDDLSGQVIEVEAH